MARAVMADASRETAMAVLPPPAAMWSSWPVVSRRDRKTSMKATVPKAMMGLRYQQVMRRDRMMRAMASERFMPPPPCRRARRRPPGCGDPSPPR